MSESTNSDFNKTAFKPEEAANVIVAGITSGAIKLLSQDNRSRESLLDLAKKATENGLISTEMALAYQTALGASVDAVYLMTLRHMLCTGLSDETAKRIISTVRNNLV